MYVCVTEETMITKKMFERTIISLLKSFNDDVIFDINR